MSLDYRLEIQKAIEINEEMFEKKITYISSGTLVLTMTFIDKIVPISESVYLWLLISGWTLLALTLLFNLITCMICKRFIRRSQIEYSEKGENDALVTKVISRNKNVDRMNWVAIGLLMAGLVLLILFISINFLNIKQ